MLLLIADTFTDSLTRLTHDEQKAAKLAAFDLQTNAANPGLQFHRVDNSRDKNFWSARVGRDLRLIVHRQEDRQLLCYVDHHDAAYRWAARRRLETHPTTGAAQLVEVRETVVEYTVERVVETTRKPALFASRDEAELLSYGVPRDWLDDVRSCTEESLLDLAPHLPAEAAEALLELAVGGRPQPRGRVVNTNAFEHPDARRRFRVMASLDELERALAYPWDRWTVFLHPEQRSLVEKSFAGPARVAGSAGTGKTIVALHRAAHLARTNPDATVLLTTFSTALANALQERLNKLLHGEARLAERIIVQSLEHIGLRLYRTRLGAPRLASPAQLAQLVSECASAVPGHRLGDRFLLDEWNDVIDTFNVLDLDAYKSVTRLGRRSQLSAAMRTTLWPVFAAVRQRLATEGLVTMPQVYHALAHAIRGEARPVYDYVVVDEAQDLGVPHLRFLAALGSRRPDALFFAGDSGQRIFQQPLSWSAQGVDVRGRSHMLKVNYRTSHQIRTMADRLLDRSLRDLDGIEEDRRGTVSVFNGPLPTVVTFADDDTERNAVAEWLRERHTRGVKPNEMGVFVRSEHELPRARQAVEAAGLVPRVLDHEHAIEPSEVAIGTMHLAKGLEFRMVVVMACDEDVLPSNQRFATVGDSGDITALNDSERQLFYVACTRARDELLVTGIAPGSMYLGDLR
jgi:hypothetical protein